MEDDRGYSLLEMAVVLGLLAIIVAGALPGIGRIHQEWALWGGTRLLENSLLWGRIYAVSSNDSLVLAIDPAGRSWCWQDAGGNRYENSVRDLPAGVAIIQTPRRPLRFYQHGNAAPAGTFVVQGKAGSYRVVVSIMGRIRVERIG